MRTDSCILMALNQHGHQLSLPVHSLLLADPSQCMLCKNNFHWGDTETKIVVNFETRRAIPHIHYVGLSRVTTIDGLYVTDLCENKIAVSDDVRTEMHRLRTEGQLTFAVNPLYNVPKISLKICYQGLCISTSKMYVQISTTPVLM